jgi:signal transduction histidine kinase
VVEARLAVTGMNTIERFRLDPAGTTIGRGLTCDVILDDEGASRVHARIYRDPFGRWIIEDLNSRNGVLVEGERIKAKAVLPGERIQISMVAMTVEESNEDSAVSRELISVIDEGSEDDIVSYKPGKNAVLSPALMQHLKDFTAELLKLDSTADLYSHACMHLAGTLNTLVAVVRLPSGGGQLPEVPEVLACHFADEKASGEALDRSGLIMSKKVLDAIRSRPAPVMAGSGTAWGGDMRLTVIDNFKPHLVFAARVNDLEGYVDALYLDIIESRSPLQLFDFVEVAARQINFVQKNLLFAELERNERALREANTKLKEKDRIKDEYVSRVTHDIKGHLAAIQSCLYVASSENTGTLNEKQADFLGRAVERNTQLTAFVKELLRLTQMRLSGRFEAKDFPLAYTIAAALETIAPRAEDKSITVTSDVEPSLGTVSGDEFSINEMITNLLFNAVKYTPEGKSVHLGAKKENGMIRIDISDTGIGIPADEIDSVFDEFFRATNARKSASEGTGLGLSLVKQIVERHGGRISVTSIEGRGSTFMVFLPANE